jgi:hypothetical protein
MAWKHLPCPAVGVIGQWAGPNPLDTTNRYDVLVLGDDGNVYHYWFLTGQDWFGPETIGGGPHD